MVLDNSGDEWEVVSATRDHLNEPLKTSLLFLWLPFLAYQALIQRRVKIDSILKNLLQSSRFCKSDRFSSHSHDSKFSVQLLSV